MKQTSTVACQPPQAPEQQQTHISLADIATPGTLVDYSLSVTPQPPQAHPSYPPRNPYLLSPDFLDLSMHCDKITSQSPISNVNVGVRDRHTSVPAYHPPSQLSSLAAPWHFHLPTPPTKPPEFKITSRSGHTAMYAMAPLHNPVPQTGQTLINVHGCIVPSTEPVIVLGQHTTHTHTHFAVRVRTLP